VFLLVLLPLLLVGGRLSRRVQDSPVGGLDRALGAVFGAVRGLVAIAVIYILYSLVVPVSSQAKWVQQARTLPLIQKSASALLALLPDNDARYLQERTQDTRTAARAEASVAPHKSVQKGYGVKERRALNRLIEATGNAAQ
jgi:membrane protein required for colicin V production